MDLVSGLPQYNAGLLSRRLLLSFGVQTAKELSHRAGTWPIFVECLKNARQLGTDESLFILPRGKRNTGTSIAPLFENCPSRLAGFTYTTSHVLFSPCLAELEGGDRILWDRGRSGLEKRDTTDSGTSAETSVFNIVPLEDVVKLSILAALQSYIRSGSRNGSFSVDNAIDVLRNETSLAIGSSRVPGSVSVESIKKIIRPDQHSGVGLGDLLVMLEEGIQTSVSLFSMPVPDNWVLPCTPYPLWPGFFTSSAGAILVGHDAVKFIIAGASDREIYCSDAGVRTGERGDGVAFVEYSCIHDTPKSSSSSGSSHHRNPIGLGCTRIYLLEMSLASLERGLVLIRVCGRHSSDCTPASKHFGYRPLVASRLHAMVQHSRLKTYEITSRASVLALEDRNRFSEYSRLIREEGRIVPYTVTNEDGDIVNCDPIAASVARYSSLHALDKDQCDRVLEKFLPVCFCNSLSPDIGSERGDIVWIQCENVDECVSFRNGWAHQDCAFTPGARIPKEWYCPGCTSGAQPVLTVIKAGDGVPHVDPFNSRSTRLLKDLISISSNGDFPAALKLEVVALSSAPRVTEPVRLASAVAPDGQLPITSAMILRSLISCPSSAVFVTVPVVPVRCDFFGVVTAVKPLKSNSFSSAARKASSALANSLAALEAVSSGKSRSCGEERESITAATRLVTKLRAAVTSDSSSPFSCCVHVRPATEGAFNPLQSLPVTTITALDNVFALFSTPTAEGQVDFESHVVQLEWQIRMATLFDALYATPPKTDSLVSLTYMTAVGFPAVFWKSECDRVFAGDMTSRMHAPKPSKPNVNGRFSLLPWSYICLLYALRPLVTHLVNDGDLHRIVFAYYYGMSDALHALQRISAHGTSSGNKAMWELWHRKTPTSAYVPEGMPLPVILARVVDYKPVPLPGIQQYSPAAAQEAVVGACILAMHPLTASCGTSPHGDSGLLFDEHIRVGRRPIPPISHTFLAETVQRLDVFSKSIKDEANLLMRSHLRVVQLVVAGLPLLDWGTIGAGGDLTLASAWTWLVGKHTLELVIRAVRPAIPRVLFGRGGSDVPITFSATAGATDTSHVHILQSVDDDDREPCVVISSRALAFMARSHLDQPKISQLVKIKLSGSRIAATLKLAGLPRRVTSGAQNVTEDDVTNMSDAFARGLRNGDTVDENLINVLCGILADFGWAVTEVVLDPQGYPTKLRAVVCAPHQRKFALSHPKMLWVRVKDATFGIGMQGIDFFVLMYVHPTTLIYLPLAYFIRKRGSDENPIPLIPDLLWMESVLESRFGFPPPRYDIIDKCVGSLAAFADGVIASWSMQSTTGTTSTAGDALGSYLAANAALLSVAAGCTAEETTALNIYLHQSAQRTGSESLSSTGPCDVGLHSAVRAAHDIFFVQWVDEHPSLVRALALRISIELTSTMAAIRSCEHRAGAVGKALRGLQGFSWTISNNGGPVDTFFRTHVERWIRLCFFHAKKAIREWVSKNGVMPGQTYTDAVEPDINAICAGTMTFTSFSSKHSSYPQLITYLSTNWMSQEFEMLWTDAGRNDLSHWQIRTSNGAEGEFNVTKNSLMDGKSISDAVLVLRKWIGMPGDLDSIQQSKFISRVIRIAQIESGTTNMRLPHRKFISPLRVAVDDILSIADGVIGVNFSELIYDVASSTTLAAMRSGSVPYGLADICMPDNVIYTIDSATKERGGYYRVSVIHGCPCKCPSFFCKHLLSARTKHVTSGRSCCWRDAELVPFHLPIAPGLSVEDALLSVSDDITGVPSVPISSDATYMQQLQISVLVAKMTGLNSAVNGLLTCTPPLLDSSATTGEIAAYVSRTSALGRLTQHIDRARLSTLHLSGQNGQVASGRPGEHERSARSAAEVSARESRDSRLAYSGVISTSSALATISTTSESPGVSAHPVVGTELLKRTRRDLTGRSAQRESMQVVSQAHAEEELLSKIESLQATLALRDQTIARLTSSIQVDGAVTASDAADAESSDSDRRTWYDGSAAAYSDSAARLRDVASSTWYKGKSGKPIRDALMQVATRLDTIADTTMEFKLESESLSHRGP